MRERATALRAWHIPLTLALAWTTSGCATRLMRVQADALASSGARLEAEAAAFKHARDDIVQLRQSHLAKQRQELTEIGQYNARQLGHWRVATTPDRARRLELFESLVAASDALAANTASDLPGDDVTSRLAIDRAALHRMVRHLSTLSRRPEFAEWAFFYSVYSLQIGDTIEANLRDLHRESLDAAEHIDEKPATVSRNPSSDPTRPIDSFPGPGEPRPTVPNQPTQRDSQFMFGERQKPQTPQQAAPQTHATPSPAAAPAPVVEATPAPAKADETPRWLLPRWLQRRNRRSQRW